MSDSLPIFAALAHEGRQSVFRLMVRHMPEALRPTQMALTLGLKPNTLSQYLADLQRARLVTATRQGRAIDYSVRPETMTGLIAYLTDDCCRGRPDMCLPSLHRRPTMTRPFNVLFVCSGNSARSIFAEAILRRDGADRFTAYSAGSRPRSELNPQAVEMLRRMSHDITGLRAKNLTEFQQPDAPRMDFVFTVCDRAADEECAPWPGQPITAHWSTPDPVAATGTEGERGLAFAEAYRQLYRRIHAFVALPVDGLSRIALQDRVDTVTRLVTRAGA